jgi:hypothetical protein
MVMAAGDMDGLVRSSLTRDRFLVGLREGLAQGGVGLTAAHIGTRNGVGFVWLVTIRTTSGVVTVEADFPPERRGDALGREVCAELISRVLGWVRRVEA